jgi:N-acetylgalactosamine 4-sulfate 6-O-sulfotransferase
MSLGGSLYSVFLEEWLKIFGKDQIFVLKAEDYFHNRTTGLNRVFDFLSLGLFKSFSVSSQFYVLRSAERITDAGSGVQDPRDLEPTYKKIDPTPMLPQTKKLLDEFFLPFNQRLARMLHDERFLWKL